MDTNSETGDTNAPGQKVRPRGRLLRIGAGVGLAVALIAVVSVLTGGKVTNQKGGPDSVLVGRHVKSFSLPGLRGGTIAAPWESHHASVIVFFASFCLPCQAEMPKVSKYVRTHRRGRVEVLAIDADDKRSYALAMVEKDNTTFPVAFDPNGVVTSGIFGFENVPESVFVNAHGVVTGVHLGAIPPKQLGVAISSLQRKRAT